MRISSIVSYARADRYCPDDTDALRDIQEPSRHFLYEVLQPGCDLIDKPGGPLNARHRLDDTALCAALRCQDAARTDWLLKSCSGHMPLRYSAIRSSVMAISTFRRHVFQRDQVSSV